MPEGPPARGPWPTTAQRPAAYDGPAARSRFSTVFCPAVKPCACTGLHRIWACKMDDGEFEFVYHYNIKQSFRSFSILSFVACCYVKNVVILCLFVRLQNPKERKSILNDVSYFQITVWDWKFHIKLCNEICELRIVTEFMIFSLSKYGLKITYIVR